MAKEYIERNALIAEYDRVHIGSAGGARKLMVDAPTADVVEVVRCKECKHCELRYPAKAIGEEAIEGYYCYPNQRYVKSTDFCNYGERSDGDV